MCDGHRTRGLRLNDTYAQTNLDCHIYYCAGTCSHAHSCTTEPTATPTPAPEPTATATSTPTPEPTATPTPIPVSDVELATLVALYEAAGGDAWKSNGNWLSEAYIGEWHGVTIDSGGFVTELDLRSNRLSGEIPPELGSILESYLQSLDLSGNQLSGEIPLELGSLSNHNLATLDISGNDFDGEMPSELGSLSNLATLDLSGPMAEAWQSLQLARLLLEIYRLSLAACLT